MSEERMQILQMLSDGKITPVEANDLLFTLDAKGTAPGKRPRLLKIRVSEGNKEKVNVNLPLSLAKIALKFIPKDAMGEIEKRGINIDDLMESISDGLTQGRLVTVDDGEDRIEIEVE